MDKFHPNEGTSAHPVKRLNEHSLESHDSRVSKRLATEENRLSAAAVLEDSTVVSSPPTASPSTVSTPATCPAVKQENGKLTDDFEGFLSGYVSDSFAKNYEDDIPKLVVNKVKTEKDIDKDNEKDNDDDYDEDNDHMDYGDDDLDKDREQEVAEELVEGVHNAHAAQYIRDTFFRRLRSHDDTVTTTKHVIKASVQVCTNEEDLKERKEGLTESMTYDGPINPDSNINDARAVRGNAGNFLKNRDTASSESLFIHGSTLKNLECATKSRIEHKGGNEVTDQVQFLCDQVRSYGLAHRGNIDDLAKNIHSYYDNG